MFPFLLPRIQRWSAKKQLAWIGRFYLLQIIFFAIPLVTLGGELGYWYGRGWPPSRLPVFLMGVLGARLSQSTGQYGSSSVPYSYSYYGVLQLYG